MYVLPVSVCLQAGWFCVYWNQKMRDSYALLLCQFADIEDKIKVLFWHKQDAVRE